MTPHAIPASVTVFEDGDPNENPWVNGKPASEQIEVCAYDPHWSQIFAAASAAIKQALGATALQIEHVGSTAVPGLPAKPVIDIDLIVPDPALESAYIPALEALDYDLTVREPSWYQHRMLRHATPRMNLHVFGPDCPEHFRHLLFRDWLREHQDDRDRYAEIKQLATQGVEDVAQYNRQKSDFIRSLYRTIFEYQG